MDKTQKYSIIGPGVMGEALISGLLSNQVIGSDCTPLSPAARTGKYKRLVHGWLGL